jgi:hypothetical protein
MIGNNGLEKLKKLLMTFPNLSARLPRKSAPADIVQRWNLAARFAIRSTTAREGHCWIEL